MEEFEGRRIAFEPLLVCMIATIICGNRSRNRRKLGNILHKASPYVFMPFFTLTGAALNFASFGTSALFAVFALPLVLGLELSALSVSGGVVVVVGYSVVGGFGNMLQTLVG